MRDILPETEHNCFFVGELHYLIRVGSKDGELEGAIKKKISIDSVRVNQKAKPKSC